MAEDDAPTYAEAWSAYLARDEGVGAENRFYKALARWLKQAMRERGLFTPPRAGLAIVDVGCGDGGALDAFLAAKLPVARYLGVDREAALLARAEARLTDAGETKREIAFLEADLTDAAAAAALTPRFDADLVLFARVLHRLSDDALAPVMNALKKSAARMALIIDPIAPLPRRGFFQRRRAVEPAPCDFDGVTVLDYRRPEADYADDLARAGFVIALREAFSVVGDPDAPSHRLVLARRA